MGHMMLFLGFLIFLFIPSKQAVHIFQQNRYQMERYRAWLYEEVKSEYKKLGITLLFFLPIFALILLANHTNTPALLALVLFIYSYMEMKIDDNKSYIKPLTYTHRVQRLLACLYVLSILIYFLLRLLPFSVMIFLLGFSYLLPWLLLFPAAWIMLPIEKRIRRFYVDDAKKILASYPDLIRIGITGSYGKTSVKMISQHLLQEKYYSFMTPESYNNLMGITISIREKLKHIHEVFICEMGADHVGEITELARYVKPHIAVVTAIGPQHLSTFHTQENIISEKMQLIEQLDQLGYGILNADNEYIRNYQRRNPVRIIWYGIHHEADIQAMNICYHKDGTTFQVQIKEDIVYFQTKLLGEHNVSNILAGIALANLMKVPMEKIQQAVKSLPYIPHRLELRKLYHYTLIDNAYNSNPQSAYDSLEVLKQMPNQRILITPGFLDLGDHKAAEHKKFAKHMVSCCDEIILVGRQQTKDIFETLQIEKFSQDKLHVVNSTIEALNLSKEIAGKEDVVLIENDLPDAFIH